MNIDNSEEERIIETIKGVLLSKHPIVNDRIDLLLHHQKQFDISMKFVNVSGKDYTYINFLDGYTFCRNSIDSQIIINGLVTKNTINELIFNILLDHDYIRDMYFGADTMKLSFIVDLRENNMKGIGCRVIGLGLDFHFHPEKEILLKHYSESIIKLYTDELNHAFGLSDEIKHKIKKLKYTK